MKGNNCARIHPLFWLSIGVALALTGCSPTTVAPPSLPTPTMTSEVVSPTPPVFATPGPLERPPETPLPVLPVPTILAETGQWSVACPTPILVSQGSPTREDNTRGWQHYGATSIQKSNVQALSAAGEWLGIATEQGVIWLNQRTLEYELFSHTHTIPDITLDKVYTLAVDDQGRLWAGGAHGLVRYDNNDDNKWKVIYTEKEVSNFALDDQGNLWRFTFYGRVPPEAYRFQGQEPPPSGDWTPEPVAWQISLWNSLWEESNNWYLIALYENRMGKEVRDANDNIWTYSMHQFYRNHEPVQSIPMNFINVNVIAVNTVQGGIWIGSDTGLLYSDGQTLSRYQFTGQIAVGYPLIYAFAFADNGNGWAATSKGVLHFNERTGKWENAAQVNAAIPFGPSYLIAPDQQDGLWVLGDDYLAHFDGKQLERWNIPREISHSEPRPGAIVQFQDQLWVAAEDNGLWRFDGQTWVRVLPLTILSLTQDHNEKLYILERIREKHQSILVYDGTDWRRLPECAACEWLFPSTLTSDTDHRIWGADTSSIWRYSADEGWCNILTLPDMSDYTAIQVDTHGGVWIANYRGGILHCAQEHCKLWKWEQDGSNTITSGAYSHLLRPLITAMALDSQDRLWIGGWGLLSVYDPAAVP